MIFVRRQRQALSKLVTLRGNESPYVGARVGRDPPSDGRKPAGLCRSTSTRLLSLTLKSSRLFFRHQAPRQKLSQDTSHSAPGHGPCNAQQEQIGSGSDRTTLSETRRLRLHHPRGPPSKLKPIISSARTTLYNATCTRTNYAGTTWRDRSSACSAPPKAHTNTNLKDVENPNASEQVVVVLVHLHAPRVHEGELQRRVPLLRRGLELARQERVELLESPSHLRAADADAGRYHGPFGS